jgi:hypothetical protein
MRKQSKHAMAEWLAGTSREQAMPSSEHAMAEWLAGTSREQAMP